MGHNTNYHSLFHSSKTLQAYRKENSWYIAHRPSWFQSKNQHSDNHSWGARVSPACTRWEVINWNPSVTVTSHPVGNHRQSNYLSPATSTGLTKSSVCACGTCLKITHRLGFNLKVVATHPTKKQNAIITAPLSSSHNNPMRRTGVKNFTTWLRSVVLMRCLKYGLGQGQVISSIGMNINANKQRKAKKI